MSRRYLVDTNFLVQAERYYPQDIFPSFWARFRLLMERVVGGGDPPGEEECRRFTRGCAKAKAAEIAEAVAGCAPNET